MRRKILIIEDHDDTAEMLVHLMDLLNYDVAVSRNLMPLDDIIKIRPDLIMLDHRLSDGLGGVLCRTLKNTATTKHILILMVSATHDLVEIAEQCGADGHLHKPFDIEELENKIAKLLCQKNSHA